VRREIAEHLKTNPVLLDDIRANDIVAWTEGGTLQDYANHMLRSDVWGGAIEIKTYCELYAVNVVVHVLYTGKVFTVESSKTPRRIVHISYTGSHFEPLYSEIIRESRTL
jgi:hypothetical protein